MPPLPDHPQALLDLFDSLPPVGSAEMIGAWRGDELPCGHPLGGLLGALGWHGKRFESAEAVHPLVFTGRAGPFGVNPAPLALAPGWLRLAPLLRRPVVAALARRALPLARTAAPAARLRMVEHRGVLSAAMLYDALPVQDHFRRLDADAVLGLMDLRGTAPFFFVLRRGPGPTSTGLK